MAVSARLFHTVVVLGAAITASNCGRTERDSGSDRDASNDGSAQSDATYLDQTVGSGGNPIDAPPEALCVSQLCEDTGAVAECGDCLDNDKDGALDLADPECTSPCANEAACPATPVCNPGQQPCDYLDGCLPPCPVGMFCLTGCCTVIA